MQTRGMVVAAALLAAVACKTPSGATPASTAGAGAGYGDPATRDGQRVAVEGVPQAAAGQADQLHGRVALVDTQNGELAIDSGQATQQVKVAPSADITVDGKKASLSDLKQGQEVRVSLAQGADGPAAQRIEVTHTKK